MQTDGCIRATHGLVRDRVRVAARRLHAGLALMAVVAAGLTAGACSSEEAQLLPLAATDPDEVETGLPKVELWTPDTTDIVSKTEWTRGVTMVVHDSDGHLDYRGTTQMKGRGNSTWNFPKKPYALKLDRRSTVLGMPAHKRWCLLANWVDRTLMRNDVAFEIARQMPSLAYTPRGRFVELFLNGRHMGNYYLCEQIKVDKNRVDIAELSPNAMTGLGVTGGFILEADVSFDETFRWVSDRAQLPWQCKDPDEVSPAQFAYVRRFVDEMEEALYDETRFANREFARYMDLGSFADWWLVHELTGNLEPRYPKSCLMHKDQDRADEMAKMCAGPVWDFDYETFIPAYSQQFVVYPNLYYARLFDDEAFCQLVKQHWDGLKEKGLLTHIGDYIDQQEHRLEASDRLNAAMWPTTERVNGDTYLSFHDAAQRLKRAFTQKYYWLDNAITNFSQKKKKNKK